MSLYRRNLWRHGPISEGFSYTLFLFRPGFQEDFNAHRMLVAAFRALNENLIGGHDLTSNTVTLKYLPSKISCGNIHWTSARRRFIIFGLWLIFGVSIALDGPGITSGGIGCFRKNENPLSGPDSAVASIGGVMKALRLTIVLSAMVLTPAGPASSVSLNEYMRLRSVSPQNLEYYLRGLLDGFAYTNLTLERKKQPPLYCAPKNSTLDIDNFKNLLDRQIRQFQAAQSSVEVMALYTLRKRFPCSENPAQ